MTLEEIKKLPAEEAIKALDARLTANPSDDAALTLRGMRHWALSHRSLAIKDYLAAVCNNPDSPAAMLLQNANDILGFYNKDLLNP